TKQAEYNQAESLGRYSLSIFDKGKELDAFVAAIKAGKILQNQRKTNPEVMNALQTVLVKGREYNRLEGHDDAVRSVSFRPDGKTLASGSTDYTIKLWDLSFDFLMVRDCNWVRTYLAYNPKVSESDKHLCDGIGTNKSGSGF
ncbi:MAG: WD40 repeat domain-containing protein, partial [Brasilonema sp.]